jgi:subtilisin
MKPKTAAWLLLLFVLCTIPAQAKNVEYEDCLIGFYDQIEEQFITGMNGQIKKKFNNIPVALARVPKGALKKLAESPAVEYIEPDHVLRVLSQSSSWGLSHIYATDVHTAGSTGLGVKIAIMDTGVDAGHYDLHIAGGVNFTGENSGYQDENGHGTHVAGIIGAQDNDIGSLGVAPGASLYAVKVLDKSGTGLTSDAISGVEWAIKNNMQLINMSMEGTEYSKSLQRVLDKAYTSGIALFAAAGNQSGTITYPAAYQSVIAVGSLDENHVRAASSGTGPKLELMAPGVGITSLFLNQGTTVMSGTSMASPHVAGVAALLLEKKPTLGVAEIRNILNHTAVP